MRACIIRVPFLLVCTCLLLWLQDYSEKIGNGILWHPSLKLNVDRHCAVFPGGSLFTRVRPVQSVYLNDHLYIGGVYPGSQREMCRLFEYSVSLNTWDIFDIDLADFALASYQSKLLLLGGRECKFDPNGFCRTKSESPTKKVWILDDQYQLQEADILPMNKPRKSALAVGHEDHLIVAGGDGGESVTIEIYDGQTKKWLFAPTLPKTSHVYLQSVVVHHGNLYVQLSPMMSSSILCATLKLLNNSRTSEIHKINDGSSFWKEIPCPFNRIYSNLMLCQDHLFVLGGSLENNWYLFAHQPTTPDKLWINIADVSVSLHDYSLGVVRIISVSDNKLLLFGRSGSWMERMSLLLFDGL